MKMANGLFFLASASLLGPYFAVLSATSAVLKPASWLTFSSDKVSTADLFSNMGSPCGLAPEGLARISPPLPGFPDESVVTSQRINATPLLVSG
jgi:hypothetical protein